MLAGPAACSRGRRTAPVHRVQRVCGRVNSDDTQRAAISSEKNTTGPLMNDAASPCWPPETPWRHMTSRGLLPPLALAPRGPRPPGQSWVARRPPAPKGRHDNHRPAPCSCYTPAPPRGAHGPVRRPGMTHRQNAYSDARPGPRPAPGSQRGRAAAEPVIPNRMGTLTPLAESIAASHASMIHPPGPCRRHGRGGNGRRGPRRSPSSEPSGCW
jgi:hypothetical protein